MLKQYPNLKRILAILLLVTLFFAMVGCSDNNPSNAKSNDELYTKAMEILDEFIEEQKVKDFCVAYDSLMTLPNDEDKFVAQLSDANEIFQKYGVEFKYGEYFLHEQNASARGQEGIDKYRNQSAYYDVNELMNAIVYPVLFEKYGSEAQKIEGVSKDTVISAIESDNNYIFDEKKEQYDTCKEEWKNVTIPSSKYEVTYHSNGLVESVRIPIAHSKYPFSDDEYSAHIDKDTQVQKQIAGDRFLSMTTQFGTISAGYEVLSQIFTDEEITVISNYIHSLTLDEIWDRNLYSMVNEPIDYFTAMVAFDYRGNDITIHYGLNDISLQISGSNYVNELTTRWYTLWCGLCLPEGSEETVENYSDYINNNVEYNNTVYDYSYDLDANADKFKEYTISNTEQNQDNEELTDNEVQQSIPVEMSMSETITAYGVIEKNDTAFPTYRLRLSPKLTIIFDEYIGEKVYECEYLYFYDDAELNCDFPLEEYVGQSCEVTALLEDYRGGGELFLLYPLIFTVGQ